MTDDDYWSFTICFTFSNTVLFPVGELMDIFALVNSAINFILYCTMSRQFRATFAQLFRPRWLPISQHDGDGDDVNGAADKTQMTQV